MSPYLVCSRRLPRYPSEAVRPLVLHNDEWDPSRLAESNSPHNLVTQELLAPSEQTQNTRDTTSRKDCGEGWEGPLLALG